MVEDTQDSRELVAVDDGASDVRSVASSKISELMDPSMGSRDRARELSKLSMLEKTIYWTERVDLAEIASRA